MQPIEKYTPRGVNKDDSFIAIQNDGSRVYTPGYCFDIKNTRLYSNEDGVKGAAKPLKGFQEISVPGPTQANGRSKDTCIHMMAYELRDLLILWLHNDAGRHRVLTYNITTKVWKTLVEGPILNFKVNTVISDSRAGFINDYIFWTDFDNPIRQANLNETLIDPFGLQISYLKRPPALQIEFDHGNLPQVPVSERQRDTSIVVNEIADNSYRFAARFRYKDNSYSVFNKPSFLSLAAEVPDNANENFIKLIMKLSAEEKASIKEIEFAYIVNGDPTYYHFKTTKVEDIEGLEYKFNFSGESVIQLIEVEAYAKPFEAIPLKSRNFVLDESRAFITSDKTDLELNDSNLNLEIIQYDEDSYDRFGNNTNLITDGLIEGYAKEMGKYSFGIALYDEDLRYTGVTKTALYTSNKKLDQVIARVSGQVDKKFKYYSVFRKRNSFQDLYMECAAIPLLYLGDTNEFPNEPLAGRCIRFFERWYLSDTSPQEQIRKWHLYLPINIPFEPIPGMQVRITDGNSGNKNLAVIENYYPDANIIEIDYNTNWLEYPTAAAGATTGQMEIYVEIFDVQRTDNNTYYECSRVVPIQNGIIPVRDHVLKLDTYQLSGGSWSFDYNLRSLLDYIVHFSSEPLSVGALPTPTIGFTFDSDVETVQRKYTYKIVIGGTVTVEDTNSRGVVRRVAGPDYNKIIEHIGRPNSEQDFIQDRDDLPLIRYSDKFISNSNVNFLSNYGFGSTYELSEVRGPIIALVDVQDVMLAIHSQYSSSLYIGEGILRAGVDTLLTKESNVIGDDREHSRSHGTINPESVKVLDGNCFFWDQIEGVVVMYTTGGLVPISMYKMYTYFKNLARQYDPYIDNIKIVGSIDPRNREYILHFPAVGDLEGETWAFNIDYNFWVQYEYQPEATAHIKDQLFSFKDGLLYSHQGRTDGKVNYFYGEQKYSKITFVPNPQPDKNKKFHNVHIDADVIADNPEDVVVRITNDRGQETYMDFQEFTQRNQKYIAPILRDVNTQLQNNLLPRFDGDDIDSQYILLELTMNTKQDFVLNNISVIFNMSPYTR